MENSSDNHPSSSQSVNGIPSNSIPTTTTTTDDDSNKQNQDKNEQGHQEQQQNQNQEQNNDDKQDDEGKNEINNKNNDNNGKIDDSNKNALNNVGDDVDDNESKCFNPSISDDLKDEDLEKMKGDAIGNTLYSERFVLSTLLKLTKFEKDLNDDDDFEKDLCNLWDMTIEKDVIKLLLEHKCLELFAGIIRQTEDKRLTEILIGIIGNMCNLSETRDELCVNSNTTAPIIDLISCSDTLTLIQLMRLFHAALVFENSGDELMWFQHFKNSDNFVENFAFILINSMNSTLLVNALEALNAICAKFAVIELQPDVENLCFCDLFVKPTLIMGVNEAFKTLLPKSTLFSSPSSSTTAVKSAQSAANVNNSGLNNSNNINLCELNDKDILNTSGSDDTICCDTPTQNSQKIMSLFLDIHVFLSQYGKTSRKCYEPILLDLMKCITQILSPLCQPICLLPLTFNEQGIVENVNELFQALGDPFDEICFAQMITIWNLIDTNRELKEETSSVSNQKFDDDFENVNNCAGGDSGGGGVGGGGINNELDEEVNSEDICMTILEYLTRTVRNATDQQLKNSLRLHSPRTIMKLLSALSAGDSEPDIKECCIKIKTIFDILNNEDNLINYDNNDGIITISTTITTETTTSTTTTTSSSSSSSSSSSIINVTEAATATTTATNNSNSSIS